MPTPSTPEAPGGKPLLCLFGCEYLENAAGVYTPSPSVWPAFNRRLRKYRFDKRRRVMLVVSPDLLALAEMWEMVPARHDGFLSAVIADKMDDERDATLAHPLNKGRPKKFRNDWDDLTKWLRERSKLERCNELGAHN